MTLNTNFYSRAYQEGSRILCFIPLFIRHGRRMWTRVDWEEMGEASLHDFLLIILQHLFSHLCCPNCFQSQLSNSYALLMKEIHYHVLTRTQMQRETQSSKCSCSHLPVQVITGILKVSKEGDRAGKFRQLLSGQGGKSAVLKCTGRGQKTLSGATLELEVNIMCPNIYDSWALQRASIIHQY